MGFAMKVGGGFDAVFARAFAWRVLDVGYTRSWLDTVDPINAQQGVTIAQAWFCASAPGEISIN